MLDLVTMRQLKIRRPDVCCDRQMNIKKNITGKSKNTLHIFCKVCNKKNIIIRTFEKLKSQRRKLEWERRQKKK